MPSKRGIRRDEWEEVSMRSEGREEDIHFNFYFIS